MPTPLSLDAITTAGVRLVEKQGWSFLSLRSVAHEMEVTPMALYRHLPNSDALMAAVLESIVDRCARVIGTGNVAHDLCEWARQFQKDLVGFPGAAGRLLTHWFESAAMLDRIEQLLEMVHGHGIGGFEAVAVTNAVFTYVLMRCEIEEQVRGCGVVRRQLRLSGASRRLPRLTALSSHYTTAEFSAHFEFGLRALVSGMNLAQGAQP